MNNYTYNSDQSNEARKARTRIIVKKGIEYLFLKVEDIAYFFTEQKLVFAVDKENKKFLCEINSLGELEGYMDKTRFFRANRKYIINADYISKFKSIDNSKISLDLQTVPAESIIISQETAPLFKKWISSI